MKRITFDDGRIIFEEYDQGNLVAIKSLNEDRVNKRLDKIGLFIGMNNSNSAMLPRGCRYINSYSVDESKSRVNIVIEAEPRMRLLRIDGGLNLLNHELAFIREEYKRDEIREAFKSLRRVNRNKVKRLRIPVSFPYVIYLIMLYIGDEHNYVNYNLSLFYRQAPLNGLEDTLYLNNLKNNSESNFCLGTNSVNYSFGHNNTSNLSELCNDIINTMWGATFNTEQPQNYNKYLQSNIDNGLRGYIDWYASSIKNKQFILDCELIKYKDNLGGIMAYSNNYKKNIDTVISTIIYNNPLNGYLRYSSGGISVTSRSSHKRFYMSVEDLVVDDDGDIFRIAGFYTKFGTMTGNIYLDVEYKTNPAKNKLMELRFDDDNMITADNDLERWYRLNGYRPINFDKSTRFIRNGDSEISIKVGDFVIDYKGIACAVTGFTTLEYHDSVFLINLYCNTYRKDNLLGVCNNIDTVINVCRGGIKINGLYNNKCYTLLTGKKYVIFMVVGTQKCCIRKHIVCTLTKIRYKRNLSEIFVYFGDNSFSSHSLIHDFFIVEYDKLTFLYDKEIVNFRFIDRLYNSMDYPICRIDDTDEIIYLGKSDNDNDKKLELPSLISTYKDSSGEEGKRLFIPSFLDNSNIELREGDKIIVCDWSKELDDQRSGEFFEYRTISDIREVINYDMRLIDIDVINSDDSVSTIGYIVNNTIMVGLVRKVVTVFEAIKLNDCVVFCRDFRNFKAEYLYTVKAIVVDIKDKSNPLILLDNYTTIFYNELVENSNVVNDFSTEYKRDDENFSIGNILLQKGDIVYKKHEPMSLVILTETNEFRDVHNGSNYGYSSYNFRPYGLLNPRSHTVEKSKPAMYMPDLLNSITVSSRVTGGFLNIKY